MKDNIYYVDACKDSYDERDYEYKDVFGYSADFGGAGFPSRVLLDNVEYQNQGLEKITRYMCVYYSTAHGNNEENYQEGSEQRIDAKEFGLYASSIGRLDLERGAYIKDGPRTARDLKYIKGWSLVKTIDEVKHSLVNKRPVVIGSNKFDSRKALKAPYVLGVKKSYGHAVVIIGYDDNYEGGCFIIKNSYGKSNFDNGKMYLKYSDFGILYNGKYSLIDQEDHILSYKKKIMDNINLEEAKKMFELGYWNGKDPTKPMTREEVMTVLYRVMKKNEL